jgi:hypothetical protein|nr:hypothetical protein [uncultured Porphyromonas sp.]
MTQDEVLQLQRLEVNISRLGDIVTLQGARIAELEEELHLREEELSRLRTELQEICEQSTMSSLAISLKRGSTEEELSQAKQVLDGIIAEVECCIRQLADE